ncbi:MAG: DegT/DnrJ/EryC1/StrS family aminotransferase [Vulcanimicrobiota bacterium]
MIPILQLNTQYDQIQDELEAAVLSALRSTAYINGPEVEAFENEFASWHGISEAVGVGSGTEALHLAIRALDLEPEEEVISPAFTFIASAGAIALAGTRPAFCDIDPDTFNIDPADLEKRITSKTRAIVVVHLFGHPAPMDEILEIARKHDLKVIEDCAQATGAEYKGRKVGTMGDFGCFSFFPSKNLGGIGDGGMVLARTPEGAEKIRMLKSHGCKVRYYHDMLGTNSRLDTIQAAALRVKLKYLSHWNDERRRVAARYAANLDGQLRLPLEAKDCRHVYHQFTVRVPDRDKCKQHLESQGVGCMIYYPVSLHQQKAFAHLGYDDAEFPATRGAQEEVLSLPMFPELSDEQVDEISKKVKSCLAGAQSPVSA